MRTRRPLTSSVMTARDCCRAWTKSCRSSVCWLYQYQSTNTDTSGAACQARAVDAAPLMSEEAREEEKMKRKAEQAKEEDEKRKASYRKKAYAGLC